METIHIVTATNDSYAPHLAVMLNSLMINKASMNQIRIYIMDGGISLQTKKKLNKSIAQFNTRIHYLPVDDSELVHLDDQLFNNRFGKESLYRIFIPDLLDEEVEKALYLDCDLIVYKDITKLWNTNLNGYLLGAVVDPPIRIERCKKLGIKSGMYFNAGVLLLNLKKWREKKIPLKVMNFISKNPEKLDLPDQDALNAVLQDKWLQMDLDWNCPPSRFIPGNPPAILHFMGTKKPWNSNPRGKDEYFKYADKIGW